MEGKTKEKFLFHDTIISGALIIWAIVSIILMFYFSGLNQVTFTLMTFGQLFIVIGIILITKKQIYGFVSLITGIGCVILPAINQWGYLLNINFKQDNIFPIMLTTGITILGLAMIYIPNKIEKIYKKKYSIVVEAEIKEFKEIKVNNNEIAYAPIYKYTFLDDEYEQCYERYRKNNLPQIGTKENIRVNPANPEKIFVETTKASKMLIYIFGASFFMSGLGMLLTVLAEI